MKSAALPLRFFCAYCHSQQDGSADDIIGGVRDCFECNERTTIRVDGDIDDSEHRDYYAQPLDGTGREIEFRCGTEDEAVRLAAAYAEKIQQPVNLYIYPDWTVRLVRVVGVETPQK
jgi:hypothetical protein